MNHINGIFFYGLEFAVEQICKTREFKETVCSRGWRISMQSAESRFESGEGAA
jgi:hypothetical protein